MGLNCFFETVTEKHFSSYYEGKPLPPLTARSNERLVIFFKTLESCCLIRKNWQHVIDADHLILSSSRKGFLTKAVMASTLSRVLNRTATADDKRLSDYLDKQLKAYKGN